MWEADREDLFEEGHDVAAAARSLGQRSVSAELTTDDLDVEHSLRPVTLDEYCGQERVRENLRVLIAAAKDRHETLDHVLFSGPPGLGKTMIALGLGLKAVDEGHAVAFEKMESFIRILDTAEVDRKAGFRLRYLRRAQLCIVDEIGYTPITKNQANRFLGFVSDAYESSSMILATNKEITQWEELMGDQVLTTAMLV